MFNALHQVPRLPPALALTALAAHLRSNRGATQLPSAQASKMTASASYTKMLLAESGEKQKKRNRVLEPRAVVGL